MSRAGRAFLKASCFAGIIAILITVWQGLFLYEELKPVHLKISVQSTVSDQAVLFYDTGQGFREEEAIHHDIQGDGQFHAVSFPLPEKPIRQFRFDPLRGPGIVAIGEVTIANAMGETIRRIEPSRLQPLHQIGIVRLSNDIKVFQVPAGAIDPQIAMALTAPLNLSLWNTYPVFAFASKLIIKFTGYFLIFFLLVFLPSSFADPGKGILFVLLLVAVGWCSWAVYKEGAKTYLQITLRSSSPGVAAVYYDTGQGLSEEASSKVAIQESQEDKDYRFLLPQASIQKLRFDPLMGPGRVSVSQLSIIDGYGNPYKRIELSLLRPANQIAEFKVTHDQATIITSDKANDPQVYILPPTAIPLGKERPFPVGACAISLLKNVGGIGLVWGSLFWGYRRYREKVSGLLDHVFLRIQWPILCMACAFGLILSMAVVSAYNMHPDEGGHLSSARFYLQNWIPPAVDDPRMVESISGWGLSYLFNLDIVYFLAAKMTLLLQPLMIQDHIGFRLFNVLLFAILVFLIARRVQSSQLAVFALLATPQVWYIFSYFNNDAFPLFLSILIAIQCIDPMTGGYRFLHERDFREHCGGGVILGVLIGCLLLSKLNYRLFLVFLCCFAFLQMTFARPPLSRFLLLKKWLLIGFVASCIFLPRYAHDQYINHFQKTKNMIRIAEMYALHMFKPSTVEKSLSESYQGLRFKKKGITWQQMFLYNTEWRSLTFKSMTGLYGYMNFHSHPDYYTAMKNLFVLLLIVIFACTVYGTGQYAAVLASGTFCAVLLSIGVSVYYSWTTDYQPQGRYLFPIIAILMIGLSGLPTVFHRRFLPIFTTACFLMGVWSFARYALMALPKN